MIYRFLLSTLVVAVLAFAGCANAPVARTQTQKPSDEYAALDDGTTPNLTAIKKKVEEARRLYGAALRFQQRGKTAEARKNFEAAIAVLNELANIPAAQDVPEFISLTETVIQDYEDQATSLDSIDANSNFFVLRDKMFKEIEQIPVERRKYPPKHITASGSAPLELTIDLPDNTPVQQCIAFFTSEKGRRFFSKWLARTGRYFPMFDRVIDEEGAPLELRHLAMIESGLSPQAVSWAKAAGLWQFIPSTGRMYGLTVDPNLDERRDPEKATRAAARYLKNLYEDLGDWHLALAAYNCGPGRVKSAIAKANSRDYWVVRQYLPRETQQYVPLFIAATKITMDPEAYGFTSIDFEQPDEYKLVPVKGAYDMPTLSRAAGVPVEELRRLNPELLRDRTPYTPETSYGYQLRVPMSVSDNLSDIVRTMRPVPTTTTAEPRYLTYKVQRGESVKSVAAKHNISVDQLCSANNLTSRSSLKRGATLRIPQPTAATTSSTSMLASADPSPAESTSETSQPTSTATSTPNVATGGDRAAEPSSTLAMNSNPETATSAPVSSAPAASAPVTSTPKTVPAAQPKSTPTSAVARTATPKSAPATVARTNDTAAQQTERTFLTALSPKEEPAPAPAAAKRRNEPKSNAPALASNDRRSEQPKATQPKATQPKNTATAERKAPAVAATRRAPATTTVTKTHVVARGESLTAIAKAYNVSPLEVASWNNLDRNAQLRAGRKLVIQVNDRSARSTNLADARTADRASAKRTDSKNTRAAAGNNRRAVTTTTSTRYETHRVRSGESLTSIAQRYGVKVSDLQAWNSREIKGGKVQSGSSLKIYGDTPAKGDARRNSRVSKSSSTPANYTVRRGESLESIADRYGVSVKQLKKNNPELARRPLRAGEKIKVGR